MKIIVKTILNSIAISEQESLYFLLRPHLFFILNYTRFGHFNVGSSWFVLQDKKKQSKSKLLIKKNFLVEHELQEAIHGSLHKNILRQ